MFKEYEMLRKLCCTVALLAWTVFLPQGASASAEGARDFIQNVSDQTLGILASASLDVSQKERKLDELFRQSVDMDWIARFVIGRHWRTASEEQRTRYSELYGKFLINSYVPKFREYTNQKFVLKKFLAEEEGEYIVQTEIVSPDTSPIRVDYRVRQEGETYKIFDVVAEGISLIATQRSEFGSILSRSGLDSLIEKLAARV